MLVRGTDTYSNFDLESEPADDLSFEALAAHKDATERQIATYYEGTEKDEFRP
jgi:hypothetical protein